MKKCLVVGAAILDIILQIDELPSRGDDIYAYSQTMMLGGCAYNVADILRHFDASYTLFVPIGTGMCSHMVSKMLDQAMHTSPIKSSTMDNGFSLCLVDRTGERTFVNLQGIECDFEKQWFEMLDSSDYDSIFISGYEIEGDGGDVIIDFTETNKDLLVYYAPGPRVTHISEDKHKRLMSLKPIIHLNKKESLEYTNQTNYWAAARKLHEQSGNVVIITLGAEGAYYYDGVNAFLIGAEKADVMDTIGAGDAHIGTIIAMRQNYYTWNKSIVAANRVSAKVVGVEGATLKSEEFNAKEFIK